MTEFNSPPPIDPENFPKIGGIPVDLARISQQPDQRVVVQADVSGDRVSIWATSDRVEILDLDDDQIGLEVEYFDFPDTEDDEQITGKISITVRTAIERDGQRYRNPDFRARELTNATISYFESLHGSINAIMFEYPGPKYIKHTRHGVGERLDPSDNFVSYFLGKNAALKRLLEQGVAAEDAQELAKIEGAKASWLYKQIATPHGLLRVRNMFETGIEDNIDPMVGGEFVRELPSLELPQKD